jgi:hypothetical protein
MNAKELRAWVQCPVVKRMSVEEFAMFLRAVRNGL